MRILMGGVTYNITTTVTNGTYSGDTTITDTATVTITANSGYTLPDTVTVTGATQTWNKETGTLTLSNPTGNVTVEAVCEVVHAIHKLKINEAAYRVYVNGETIYQPGSAYTEFDISSGDRIVINNDSSVSRITVNGTTYTSTQILSIVENDIEVSGSFPSMDEFTITINV